MAHKSEATRVAGAWLVAASLLLVITLLFHGPPAPVISDQMTIVAGSSTRWLAVHWIAAVALSCFVVASFIVLGARSRLTETGWTLSAWAVLPIGAIWTLITAVAEATAVTHAAVTNNEASFAAWWTFSEGMGNGFAALALCVAVIASNEMQLEERATLKWAAGVGVFAGLVSFAGWALWSWFDLGFSAPIWVASSILMCLWLLWFGARLMWVGTTVPAT